MIQTKAGAQTLANVEKVSGGRGEGGNAGQI